jgi:hypothetical protein
VNIYFFFLDIFHVYLMPLFLAHATMQLLVWQ